MAEWIIARHC